jgi:hypothetical protein
LIGQSFFGAVLLNPDFAVDDVGMEDDAIKAIRIAPTDINELVMIAFGIKNGLGLDTCIPNSAGALF